jgi:hypothetical protein
MKSLLKILCVIFLLGQGASLLKAQSKLYAGPGFGLDYGGIGGKLEFVPVKYVGLFGGIGFNFRSAGWNTGLSAKLAPDKKYCPMLMAFYGYNGVFMVWNDTSSPYNMTSYGFSFGVGLDMKTGIKNNKISIGLFVPVREQKFIDNYNAAKNDSSIENLNVMLPIAFSIGYNFSL